MNQNKLLQNQVALLEDDLQNRKTEYEDQRKRTEDHLNEALAEQ